MKVDRETQARVDPMDRFRRPKTLPFFISFFAFAGGYVTSLLLLSALLVPKPFACALIPALAIAGLIWWLTTKGGVAILDDVIIVNNEIFRWADITKVLERYRGSHATAAGGADDFGGGETWYRH